MTSKFWEDTKKKVIKMAILAIAFQMMVSLVYAAEFGSNSQGNGGS